MGTQRFDNISGSQTQGSKWGGNPSLNHSARSRQAFILVLFCSTSKKLQKKRWLGEPCLPSSLRKRQEDNGFCHWAERPGWLFCRRLKVRLTHSAWAPAGLCRWNADRFTIQTSQWGYSCRLRREETSTRHPQATAKKQKQPWSSWWPSRTHMINLLWALAVVSIIYFCKLLFLLSGYVIYLSTDLNVFTFGIDCFSLIIWKEEQKL